jgi:hypothetical protein
MPWDMMYLWGFVRSSSANAKLGGAGNEISRIAKR